jgi:hypothetical protein
MTDRYSEWLRVIGQWLDVHQAQSIALIGTPHTLVVRGRPLQGTPGERTFTEEELAELNRQAREQRRAELGTRAGPWATRRRALDHKLDRTAQQLLVIRSGPHGLWVLGADPQRPTTPWFPLEDLEHRDARQRSERPA